MKDWCEGGTKTYIGHDLASPVIGREEIGHPFSTGCIYVFGAVREDGGLEAVPPSGVGCGAHVRRGHHEEPQEAARREPGYHDGVTINTA